MADVEYYDQDEVGEEQEQEKERLLLVSDQELDTIHDGLIFPTEDERLTLRRVPDSIPWNAYCKFPMNKSLTMYGVLTLRVIVIAFIELAERFSVCRHVIGRSLPYSFETCFLFTCVVLWMQCCFRAFL